MEEATTINIEKEGGMEQPSENLSDHTPSSDNIGNTKDPEIDENSNRAEEEADTFTEADSQTTNDVLPKEDDIVPSAQQAEKAGDSENKITYATEQSEENENPSTSPVSEDGNDSGLLNIIEPTPTENSEIDPAAPEISHPTPLATQDLDGDNGDNDNAEIRKESDASFKTDETPVPVLIPTEEVETVESTVTEKEGITTGPSEPSQNEVSRKASSDSKKEESLEGQDNIPQEEKINVSTEPKEDSPVELKDDDSIQKEVTVRNEQENIPSVDDEIATTKEVEEPLVIATEKSEEPARPIITDARYAKRDDDERIKILEELQAKAKKNFRKMSAPFVIESSSRVIPAFDDERYWKWANFTYVGLPFSPLNTMSGKQNESLKGGGRMGGSGRRNAGSNNSGRNQPGSNKAGKKKWDIIVNKLRRLKVTCEKKDAKEDMSAAIKEAITAYWDDADQKSNFEMLSRGDLQTALVKTIPVIVEYALSLPNILAEPIPILQIGENKSIHITRKLCCGLLANAFFCTFPEPNKKLQMPDINFFPLYNDTNNERCEGKKEKIKCILNYFQMMSKMDENFQQEIVSFERICLQEYTQWDKSTNALCNVDVEVERKIEDADGMLQVDFANKRIGGGVLNDGLVMEEIRFCISPELIVSRLFTETMNDDEAVIINGSQVFSRYTGYMTRFKFTGPLEIAMNQRPVDKFGRTNSQIVAMDATPFRNTEVNKQFEKIYIDRELHKCLVGFGEEGNATSSVATGNWGCGVFNGNIELKFLIQWMAASQCNRPRMQYHAWEDHMQSKELHDIADYLKDNNVQVGQLYRMVLQYNARPKGQANLSLFSYLKVKPDKGCCVVV